MSGQGSRWRKFAQESAAAFRARLDRLASTTSEEREQLARRVEQAIAGALEVPPELAERIEESAARLMAQSRGVDPLEIAWDRTRERARRTAVIGAVTTIPAVVPGAGTALAALGLVADWRYVADQQRDLVLEIAALFGQWPENPTEEARNLFLAASATAFAAPSAGKAVTEILARQVARRGIARLLPGAGAAVAGALNYIATIALGRVAIHHFGTRAGFDIRGLIPEQAHPALPWLRNAIVDAIEAGREAELFSEEARNALSALSRTERDELIDMAATMTLARGRDAASDPLVAWLGSTLGFTQEDVARVVERALRSALPLRQKLAAKFSSLAERTGGAAEAIWRRVGQLARPRRKKRPRKRQR
jgi:uncharacterized protein (DUF697 family)